MTGYKTWILGRSEACDLVIADNSVSSQHARLATDGQQWLLEDLGSTNGTWIDGEQLPPRQPVPVTPRNRIILGLQAPMPWPAMEPGPGAGANAAPNANVIRIGRAPDNDVVIDLPMISWRHAMITQVAGQLILEDTGSRNGVALNRIENQIRRSPLQLTDDVFFGSYKMPASQLLRARKTNIGESDKEEVAFTGSELVIGRDPSCDQPLDNPTISWRHAKLTRTADGIVVEDLGSRNGTFINGNRISTRILIKPGDQIGLGSFRFQWQDSGALVRREYHGNVTIEASNVSVILGNGTRLIEPASFTIYPSELVALMGPAGSGKTTLLKALNGYTRPAEGAVLFNGASLYDYYDLFRLQMGYVPQDDIVHPQLTVAEALRFSVQLRTDLSEREIDERIDKVLDDLGIRDKKNTIIGSPERKVLSGGQRKRVNIALELIHDTPVLFLDEPTSGLSSYDAEGVVRLLKRLSQEGKTIVTTIHQPSTEMFREFDDLIMMARDPGGCGAVAYFGPAYPDSILFFRPPSAAEAAQTGKIELSPEMLLSGLATQTTAAWQHTFRNSPYHKQFIEERSGTQPEKTRQDASQASTRPFDLRQWLALTQRNALCKLRDRAQTAILLLQAPLFALLIVAVIHPLTVSSGADMSGDDLSRKLAITHFLMVVAAIWFGCNNAARDIVGEWSIYQRERMVSLKLPSYIFSKLGVLFAVGLFQCLLMLSIVYVGCGLHGNFFIEFFILALSTMIGAAIGLCLSARAETTESAIALLPVVLLPIIALGGGLQPTFRLAKPVQWASALVPSRWAYEANISEEGAKWSFFPKPKGTAAAVFPAVPPGNAACAPEPPALIDAAEPTVPHFYVATDGDCSPVPSTEHAAGSQRFRPTLAFCLMVLMGMFLALVATALGFLRMRDLH
jgi:ABC-type multidrug transport system ATPase subunit/pSer/pThr/pTyr-binding forkhead associated (FHA) protein/ABC-type multidrug transport system permease subunit